MTEIIPSLTPCNSFESKVALVDVLTGECINPATSEKQDEIIAALGGISSSNLEGLGNITIGTSEVEIAITGTPTESIRIQADNDNAGIVFIGKTGVLSDGTNDFVRLDAGDEVVISYDDATNAIYAISDTVAQVINVGALL